MASDYSEVSPVVETTHGKVQGTLLKTIYDEPFYAFDGVPYAEPPLGKLRFKQPFDLKPWLGVRDCTKPLDKCLQVHTQTKNIEGSEDCLYLYISVKTVGKPLPVMVYVHGGMFKTGDPTRRAWAPDYFMREDVVHISIGYRLGVIGFLSFKDPSVEVPGNAGLKDIVHALKWIKANAHNFNGNPEQITFFGHSSGSCLVQMLLASPQAEGLFNKAILMGGFGTETNRLPNMEYRMAKHLGYKGANSDADVFDFICKADPKLLVTAKFFTPEEKIKSDFAFMPFLPSVETYATPTSILFSEPIELQRNAWGNHIPIIIGITSGEGITFARSDTSEYAKNNPEMYLPQTLNLRCDPGQCIELGTSLLQFFSKNNEPDLAEIYNHNMAHAQQRVIRARLAYSKAKTYVYRFDFDSPDFNFYRIRSFGLGTHGASHADQLGYIYVLPIYTFKLEKSRREFGIICEMVSMFTEFAKTSDPNSNLTKPLVDWKPVTASGPYMVLNIAEELKFIQQPELNTCEITLPLGKIKGIKLKTIYNDDYYSFEKLPFAKPPIGELRFKSPQPARPWNGTLDCTHFDRKPVQRVLKTNFAEGVEDCLYLNVYSKKLISDKPLPVMVHIFGGAFSVGGATRETCGPDYFMAKDVVLVTFNYRLNCLGFLSLKDPSLNVPGNAGLKDQVLALKWVKQYISHFNGDENNITVFGQSAGGCCTHYMMCTEKTRGLFNKAILMSGTIYNYWSNNPPADFAYRLAKHHGYKGDNNDAKILKYLQAVPALQLVNYNLVTSEDRRNGFVYAFGPTVEPYVTEDCVVPKLQLEMAREAWSNDIPAMLGGTSFEGLNMYSTFAAKSKPLNNQVLDPPRVLPYDVRVNNTEEKSWHYSKKIAELHFGKIKTSSEFLFNFLDYQSYKAFWHGIDRALHSRLTYAKAATYLYRFDFDSPDFNFYRKKFCGNVVTKGVCHGDDLSYLFLNSNSWKLDKSSPEYRTIQRMIGIWSSFAATSNPNCEEIADVEWKPSTKEQAELVLNISNDVKIIDLPEHGKLQVWNSMYKPESLY
ncbi:esterase B1-like [Drosophila willistoni]|uniref:esterase B1-like n=1 Tax=Drosophila willistoni TaxID=7260 RepID=UPI001F07579B|nr:esterase B1-like [Drosophila willistoni]